MIPRFKVEEGGLAYRFSLSRKKIQVYAGGFANGKTASAVVLKGLTVALNYPGANILVARSTYPKLNDTIRKEWFKWMPTSWKKSWSKHDNTLVLKNGTTINFRYIAQQGKQAQEATTSNLLSATYDLIIVDQIEDPEIIEKDFDDLLGRLRGMARYEGNDPTMPKTGPRWLVVTCNPTRNWFYRSIIRPLHVYQETGRKLAELIVDTKTGEPIIDLFEGSTYENASNLEPDFIETLEAKYRGQMRSRFLLGEWAAYEGLVYPQFDDNVHVVPHDQMLAYYEELQLMQYRPVLLEGFDYGLAVPSCYLIAFVDSHCNVCIVDGFYGEELSIDAMSKKIKQLRRLYGSTLRREGGTSFGYPFKPVFADPAIFRRSVGDKQTVGQSIAALFKDEGINMQRGNNDIINGITKIQGYLNQIPNHRNPFTGGFDGPHLYVSEDLPFLINEFTDYYWQRNTQGEVVDKPQDRNDHGMDTVKYMLSLQPEIGDKVPSMFPGAPTWARWHEVENTVNPRIHRYVR